MNQIIFYGCGNISQTIIKGLILDGFAKKNILYIDRNPLNKKKLSQYGIKSADKSKLTTTKNLIILAVKPKDTLAACKEISAVISAPQLISLVAGIKIKSLKKLFVWNTLVTPGGIQSFIEQHPEVEVIGGL